MRAWQAWSAVAAAVAFLTACGGGSDPAPVRGGVVQVDPFPGFSREQIDARTAADRSQALTGAAVCNVTVQRVRYQTLDPKGANVTASTAVMAPAGPASDPRCSGSRPVVLYAHGTTTLRSFNMADVANNGEAGLAMAMYAAQGFIVVAPNYLGYDTSSLGWHPYLNAEASAIDMIDGLRAARAVLNAGSGARASSRLVVTGYSQGGHVAMATHKVLERDHANEFAVTASGPMSGPYNLVTLGDAASLANPPQINAGATIFVPLLLTSYQRSYGGIYAQPGDVYQAPFAATAETLFPTDTPVADLIAQGKLPADPTLTRLFGPGGLLTDAFRTGYAASPYRAALVTNTLTGVNQLTGDRIGWTPRAPVVMCAGANDPTVFFTPNQPVALQIFQSRGFNGAVSLNLEDRATLPAGAAGDQIFAGFQAAKTAAGANVLAAYHGSLVPPFCNALVRASFQQILAASGG